MTFTLDTTLGELLERVMNFGLEVVHSRHGTKSISKRYNR